MIKYYIYTKYFWDKIITYFDFKFFIYQKFSEKISNEYISIVINFNLNTKFVLIIHFGMVRLVGTL